MLYFKPIKDINTQYVCSRAKKTTRTWRLWKKREIETDVLPVKTINYQKKDKDTHSIIYPAFISFYNPPLAGFVSTPIEKDREEMQKLATILLNGRRVHEGLVSSEGLGWKAYQQVDSMVKPTVFFGWKIEMQVETCRIYPFSRLGEDKWRLSIELTTGNCHGKYSFLFTGEFKEGKRCINRFWSDVEQEHARHQSSDFLFQSTLPLFSYVVNKRDKFCRMCLL